MHPFLVLALVFPLLILSLLVYDFLREWRISRFLSTNGFKSFKRMAGRFPIVGHMVTLMRTIEPDDCHVIWWHEKTKELGKSFEFVMPVHKNIVFTVDPELIKHFISGERFNEGVYGKGERMHLQFLDFFGNGIFNVDGEQWKWHRSVASYLFHTNKLKAAIPVFHEKSKKLFGKMESLIMESRGVDMQDMFMRYTLDSFAELGFGVDLNSIEQEVNQFQIAFDFVQTHTHKRGRYGDLWPLKEKLVHPKQFYKHLDYMNEYINHIIQRKRKMSPEELRASPDLLSQLLCSEEASIFTDAMLRDFVMNFLIAGRDTTALLLTWTLYMLSQHQDVLEKCLEEMNEVIGNGIEFEPTWKNQKDLKYLKWTLQETLRLYPPVPIDGYHSTKDDVTPDGYFIPKDTTMIYCAYSLHRQPDLWPEPEQFKPERFQTPPKPFTYLPFHGGPRTCLGMEMAYLEAKIMLCNLLRRYSFQVHPDHEVRPKSAIMLTSIGGMPMIVNKRN